MRSEAMHWHVPESRALKRRQFAELLNKMVARLFNSLGLRATAEASCVVRIPNANVYRFGDPDGARPVLRAVNWTVREGESWAVVGSGAGEKTTLLEVSRFSFLNVPPILALPATYLHVLCSPPLDMPVIYGRRVDPAWEHAGIPLSTWWASPVALAQAASYQRGHMFRLVRTSTKCCGRRVLRLYCPVWRGSR